MGNYLKADGFDAAIIGIDMNNERVVYDKTLMIEILMEDEQLTEEDAIDFLAYNVWGAYVGENTPLYIDSMTNEELEDIIGSI
jgi:hypothetical protein